MTQPVWFAEIWGRVEAAVGELSDELRAGGLRELMFVRDLWGRVRLLLPVRADSKQREAVRRLALSLADRLGAHAYAPERAVLEVEDWEVEKPLKRARTAEVREITVKLIDRQVTAGGWSLAGLGEQAVPGRLPSQPARFTLFSLKGGVGRSTTAAVMARHWAERGKCVLVVDLDLESPGVSSLLLDPRQYPDFGVVDWFVEELVGQGDQVVAQMTARPAWAQELRGDVLVAPALARASGEYLAKLGRVYLDLPPKDVGQEAVPWLDRLRGLIASLEQRVNPDLLLIDSRNGLSDIGAAAVAALDAQVLLFAVDSEASWSGYRVLFEHWNAFGTSRWIRERLATVAGLVPETGSEEYLESFRQHAWDLFRETLYDEAPPDAEAEEDLFTFDLEDEAAPHWPAPVFWNRGLAGGSPIYKAERESVALAYQRFLDRMDQLYALMAEQ